MTVYVVMGVSGAGKSTIGTALAEELDLVFLEGDDFHPLANREKMANAIPLANEDRRGWIDAITEKINEDNRSCVLACSALNDTVRGWLRESLEQPCTFVFLEGDPALIATRLKTRRGHFFDPALLDSQFAALEPPADAITAPVDHPPEQVCRHILNQLGL